MKIRAGIVDIEWIALALRAQAKALSGQVAILEAHVELLIDRLDDQEADDAAPLVVEAPPICPHEEDYRLDAGSMRSPLRFFCKACRRFVDPARPSDLASPPRSPVDVS